METNENAQAHEGSPDDPTQVRYLSPETCKIHLGTFDALHVSIPNERIYGGVYAAYVFPVPEPSASALQASALAALACLAGRGRRR